MEDFGYTVKGGEDQQTKKRQKQTLMLLVYHFYEKSKVRVIKL